jgi:hypothetical protein
MARAEILHETYDEVDPSGCRVELHYIKLHHHDRSAEYGYRFMWRDAAGRLLPHRGQARIPKLALAQRLMAKAMAEGWGNLDETGKRILTFQERHAAKIKQLNEAVVVAQ